MAADIIFVVNGPVFDADPFLKEFSRLNPLLRPPRHAIGGAGQPLWIKRSCWGAFVHEHQDGWRRMLAQQALEHGGRVGAGRPGYLEFGAGSFGRPAMSALIAQCVAASRYSIPERNMPKGLNVVGRMCWKTAPTLISGAALLKIEGRNYAMMLGLPVIWTKVTGQSAIWRRRNNDRCDGPALNKFGIKISLTDGLVR